MTDQSVNVAFDSITIERLSDGIKVGYHKDGKVLAYIVQNIAVGEGIGLRVSGLLEATVT